MKTSLSSLSGFSDLGSFSSSKKMVRRTTLPRIRTEPRVVAWYFPKHRRRVRSSPHIPRALLGFKELFPTSMSSPSPTFVLYSCSTAWHGTHDLGFAAKPLPCFPGSSTPRRPYVDPSGPTGIVLHQHRQREQRPNAPAVAISAHSLSYACCSFQLFGKPFTMMHGDVGFAGASRFHSKSLCCMPSRC